MRMGAEERPRHDTRPLITPRSFLEISTAAKDFVRETRRGYWSHYRYEYGVASRAVLGQQANLDRLLKILDEDIEQYGALADEYNRILLTLSSEGAGVFGQVIKLVAGTLGVGLGRAGSRSLRVRGNRCGHERWRRNGSPGVGGVERRVRGSSGRRIPFRPSPCSTALMTRSPSPLTNVQSVWPTSAAHHRWRG